MHVHNNGDRNNNSVPKERKSALTIERVLSGTIGSQGSKKTVVVPSLFRGLLLLATPTGTNGLVTAAFQLDGDFGMATGLPAPWHLAKQPPGDVPQHPAPAGTRVVRSGSEFKPRLSMSQGGHSIHEDFRMLRRQVQHSLKPVSQRIRTVPSVQRDEIAVRQVS